jgi:hypothetical protein
MAGGHLVGIDRSNSVDRSNLPHHVVLDRLEEIWRWALGRLRLEEGRWRGMDAVLVVPQNMTATEVGCGCGCGCGCCYSPLKHPFPSTK